MAAFGALAFLTPWWLAALAALPILYWLLRVTPPAPRRARFPAIRLLFGLTPKEETPAKTPLWLLLLRLLVATLVILALAHPLLNPAARLDGQGPVIAVVDDGWTAGRNWAARKTTLEDLVDRAERAGRPVMLLTTAPSLTGEPPRLSRLMPAAEARSAAAAIEPKPWPVDRPAALAALDNLPYTGEASVVYLSDGLDDDRLTPFLERLQRLGAVELLSDEPGRLPRLLSPPAAAASELSISASRMETGFPDQAVLRASGDDGRLIAREDLRWAEADRDARVQIALPIELRNRIARIEIEGEASAGAVVLLDERWRRRPVGLVSGGPLERQQPLLADTYYLERALTPFSEVRNGTIAELLQRQIAVLVLADVGRLAAEDRNALDAWVRKGGMVIRFAGPRMANVGDDFVPAPLRGGGRIFGGAMSWAQPVALAPFEPAGPFDGLAIPPDVRVSSQVLAEPSLDLAGKTWARLTDGTPLVTADKRGDGWLVLMHTTATPEWSNLPLSGLFVEMLQRLVALSQGVAGDAGDTPLPPLSSLDGFGRLSAPPPAALAILSRAFATTKAGPKFPPGFYGSEVGRRALNLSPGLSPLKAIAALPTGIGRGAFGGGREVDFKPWLLATALVLALVDLAASLALRGLWPKLARPGAAAILLAFLAGGGTAFAQTAPGPTRPANDDNAAVLSTLATHLGYVRTGNPDIDQVSRAGLSGLGAVLSRRTAVDPAPPIEIDIERDELAFYPLLYWPVVAESPRPSPVAMARINAFLRRGGMILFDTRDAEAIALGGVGPAGQRLRDILRQLDLPALRPIPDGHVLTKSFYLIDEFPGRWTGRPLWVEDSNDRVNDGVSSVIVGAHDWAAAWATDARGQPMFATVPGGEGQRETALRFGVNLVMYALTGNYKTDQVHVETILERLRR